jgi:hypothetical protein
MVKYLRELLAGKEAFVITVRTVDCYYGRVGLVDLDEVGIVIEGPFLFPWANITYLGIEFQ